MDHYQEIPKEIYGRWYKVVNEEFGEVIQSQDNTAEQNTEDQQQPPTTEQSAQPRSQPKSSTIQRKIAFVSNRNRIPRDDSTSREVTSNQTPENTITREEETSLADFLAVGLSLTEARSMKENEDKLAAIKLQARELKRQTQRGAITSRGADRQTRLGPGSSTGRRGGLTFN